MQKLLLVIVVLLPLGVCAQSAAKPQVDTRSAFEIILTKLKNAQAYEIKNQSSNSETGRDLIRRLQNANNILLNIKTRRSLIAFLLEPPDLVFNYEEPLRLQWVQILQNEEIADALATRQPPRPSGTSVILQ